MKVFKQVIFFIFIFFLFSSLIPGIRDYKNKISFYNQTKKEYEAEKKRQIELQTEIAKKKSTDEVEKTIRNKLNLLKENEIVLIVPTPTYFPTPTPTPNLANWQRWWNIFFKQAI